YQPTPESPPLHAIVHPPQALISLLPLRIAPTAEAVTPAVLICHWCIPHRPGNWVQVEIAAQNAQVRATALVLACRLNDYDYSFELAIPDPEQAFQVRMVEQLCYINRYREQVLRLEGRDLDPNQAAAEWISRFAARFPSR
ncbi:MAG TPA: hypothetical protein VIS52_01120, partial [Motiliproteus sp.]